MFTLQSTKRLAKRFEIVFIARLRQLIFAITDTQLFLQVAIKTFKDKVKRVKELLDQPEVKVRRLIPTVSRHVDCWQSLRSAIASLKQRPCVL